MTSARQRPARQAFLVNQRARSVKLGNAPAKRRAARREAHPHKAQPNERPAGWGSAGSVRKSEGPPRSAEKQATGVQSKNEHLNGRVATYLRVFRAGPRKPVTRSNIERASKVPLPDTHPRSFASVTLTIQPRSTFRPGAGAPLADNRLVKCSLYRAFGTPIGTYA
jgi:hypothetical protein